MTRPDSPGTASPGDTAPDVPAPPFPAKTLRQAPRLTAAAIVVAAAWLAALALRTGPSPLLPAMAYLAAIAVPLAVTDIRHRRLPDRLTLPSYPAAAGLLAIAAAWTPGGGHRLLGAVTGLAATLGLYLLAAWLVPGTGWGDVKLSGVLGLYLGWYGAPVLVAGLFAGVLFHALFGTALIAARRATLKTRIPFGPFMLAGAMTAILAFSPTASPAPGHPAAGPGTALSATLPSPCPSIQVTRQLRVQRPGTVPGAHLDQFPAARARPRFSWPGPTCASALPQTNPATSLPRMPRIEQHGQQHRRPRRHALRAMPRQHRLPGRGPPDRIWHGGELARIRNCSPVNGELTIRWRNSQAGRRASVLPGRSRAVR
jgi:leader peptidase (prepilin peptidase)/N-methyltransferase